MSVPWVSLLHGYSFSPIDHESGPYLQSLQILYGVSSWEVAILIGAMSPVQLFPPAIKLLCDILRRSEGLLSSIAAHLDKAIFQSLGPTIKPMKAITISVQP